MRILYKGLFLIVLCISAYNSYAKSKSVITGVRLWQAPDSLRLVFDLDKPIEYAAFLRHKPEKLTLEFKHAICKAILPTVFAKQSWVSDMMYVQHSEEKLSVTITLNKKLKHNIFMLQPNTRYGYRLVIDLTEDIKDEVLALFDLDAKAPAANAKMLIAIDAGHGGEDPGAIGPSGTLEKEVVLSIAKALAEKINQHRDLQSFLVRDGDYYVALRQRMIKARSKSADLFISIHADAFKSPLADGASVYILSNSYSTSESASWIAESENKSDLIGGIDLDGKSDLLARVLLDLSHTANASLSMDAASAILLGLGKTTKLHKNRVEKAEFMVLKTPDMPSLLVESGFISNPETERKLRSKSYQGKIADSILQGVLSYRNKRKF